MHVAAAGIVIIVVVREIQISRDKPCGHPKRAHCLDHEYGKVATAPAAKVQCEKRVLNTLFMPGHMSEGLLDGSVQLHKKRTRTG
jgi:hypothetical protein